MRKSTLYIIHSISTMLHYNRSIYSHYKNMHKINTIEVPPLSIINLHYKRSISHNAKRLSLITQKILTILLKCLLHILPPISLCTCVLTPINHIFSETRTLPPFQNISQNIWMALWTHADKLGTSNFVNRLKM